MPKSKRTTILCVGLCLAGGLGLCSTAPSAQPGGHVVVVPIMGDIDLGLAPYVERVLASVTADDLVVLDINTFGGRIDAAVRIRDALLATHAKTVAFIDPRAISAGALISLATDTIVMAEGGTIGAATPVELKGGPGAEKMTQVDAKIVSYFRKEMRATAEAKGRRGDIAEAMVDPSVVIAGLDGDKTTLTLTSTEALKYDIAAFLAPNLDAVVHRLAVGTPARVYSNMNWAERVAGALSDSAVSSILMTLGILGILIELWAPGHAVAGVLGGLCLTAFFFGHYVVHLAGLEEILLFFVGVGMMVFELLFFPGHGIIVIGGAAVVMVSLVMAMVDTGVAMPVGVAWALGWVPHALTTVFGSLIMSVVVMIGVSRFLPSTRFGKKLVLHDAVKGSGQSDDLAALIGMQGTTQTALRPAGKADFGGRRLDVTSDGGFVDAGQPVTITLVDGPRIVVRRA